MSSYSPVVVIGGGAAGLMAAGRAGELGVPVILLEKNKKLGRKLLLTGKGRCNVTNHRDLNTFIESYYDRKHYKGS
ncbi:MAG TPA: FAD-binding protein, partial [Clostridia bacterium]|nr:FAD-binding protein [Clostridia bacterium]